MESTPLLSNQAYSVLKVNLTVLDNEIITKTREQIIGHKSIIDINLESNDSDFAAVTIG